MMDQMTKQSLFSNNMKNYESKMVHRCKFEISQKFYGFDQKCEGYDYYAFADQDDYWLQDKIQKG